MDMEAEMCLLRHNLRKEGLPTNGIFMEEFRRRSVEDEKKWFRAREKAKSRLKELENMFPYAFGKYKHEKFEREFFTRLGC